MKLPRLQWQLFIAYSAVLLLLVVGLQLYLQPALHNSMVQQRFVTLQRETDLLSGVLEERFSGPLPEESADRIATEYGRRLHARVTLLNAEGKVIGDSSLAPSALSRLENHRDRPEIRESLRDRFGADIRFSDTTHAPTMYAAKALRRGGRLSGWVRLAVPLTHLSHAFDRIREVLWGASLAALLLGLAVSLAVSRWFSRPVESMIAAADQIARGRAGVRLSAGRRGELARLADAFDDMALRLQDQISRTRAEGEQIEAILKGLVEGVMVLNREGKILMINEALRSILEVPEPVRGKSFREASRVPELSQGVDRVLQGRDWVSLSFGYGERFFEVNIVRISASDSAGGVVAVFHDITKLKQLERVRQDFVANVSHELRTPLTAIKGYAETLLDGALGEPDTARSFVEIIQKHADRLSALVADLLVLSRVESDPTKVNLAPVNLRESAEASLKAVEARARSKGIGIENTIPGDLPAVLVDPKLLDEVFINLLDNAVKYTPDRGRITLAASSSGDMIRCRVSDTGMGIPGEDLNRIFERFYRIDKARSRDMGGTGLGLSIVKHIVEMFGGRVWAESEYGKGSSFFFTLPPDRAQIDSGAAGLS